MNMNFQTLSLNRQNKQVNFSGAKKLPKNLIKKKNIPPEKIEKKDIVDGIDALIMGLQTVGGLLTGAGAAATFLTGDVITGGACSVAALGFLASTFFNK